MAQFLGDSNDDLQILAQTPWRRAEPLLAGMGALLSDLPASPSLTLPLHRPCSTSFAQGHDSLGQPAIGGDTRQSTAGGTMRPTPERTGWFPWLHLVGAKTLYYAGVYSDGGGRYGNGFPSSTAWKMWSQRCTTSSTRHARPGRARVIAGVRRPCSLDSRTARSVEISVFEANPFHWSFRKFH